MSTCIYWNIISYGHWVHSNQTVSYMWAFSLAIPFHKNCIPFRSGYSPGCHIYKTYLPGYQSEPSLTLQGLFLSLIWCLYPPNQKINTGFSTSGKGRITRMPGWHEVDMYSCTSVNVTLPGESMLFSRLPGELHTIHLTASKEVLIYPAAGQISIYYKPDSPGHRVY